MSTAARARAGKVPPVPPDLRGRTDDDFPLFCESCRQWRVSSDFSERPDGYLNRACRACRNAETRRRYATEPGYADKILDYHREYHAANRKRIADQRRERYRARKEAANAGRTE